MSLRNGLLVLTTLAFLSAAAAGACALLATLLKSKPNEVIGQLRVSDRVDEGAAAAAAQVFAFKAGDKARMLREDATRANRLNGIAAALTILSAALSAAAGFLSAVKSD